MSPFKRDYLFKYPDTATSEDVKNLIAQVDRLEGLFTRSRNEVHTVMDDANYYRRAYRLAKRTADLYRQQRGAEPTLSVRNLSASVVFAILSKRTKTFLKNLLSPSSL